ncbi:transglutaminase family protein [Paraglaciecola sp.]|uniref:transglutaminase family protein n=1 Tax=Paraglaciecola sp. TaxID=1920173 RepID=UPI00273FA350|nr:transglutaminase family protein [Paraglaciecola sp.]MDP5032151.1 transglutaminase family protein [Paraglaciecola sp.]
MKLKISHVNIYCYERPVELTNHQLMLRPVESHGLRICTEKLEIYPAHNVSWKHDVFNNSVAQVYFTGKTEELRITSEYTVEQFNINPFNFSLDLYANLLPFDYQGEDLIDLAPFLIRQYPADQAVLDEWLGPRLEPNGKTETLPFLLALNEHIASHFNYGRREEPGVQSPAQTLALGSGTCRDFALLLMEAARHLGLAARFVSGYLCSSDNEAVDIAANATHAWAEIYLPGAGWKGFDPTSGILAASLHVPVATTRNPEQATPIRGSYLGDAKLFKEMRVCIEAHIIES